MDLARVTPRAGDRLSTHCIDVVRLQKLSFDDEDTAIMDDVTHQQADVMSDRLLAYKLRQATMLGNLSDYRRRIEELDVMVCLSAACYHLCRDRSTVCSGSSEDLGLPAPVANNC